MAQKTPPPPPPATREREAPAPQLVPEPTARGRAPSRWNGALIFVAGALVGAVVAVVAVGLGGGERGAGPSADAEQLQAANARLRSQVADAAAENASLEEEVFELRERVSELRPGRPAVDTTVDYGGWDGFFEISRLQLRRAGAGWRLEGRVEYLGGGACPLGYVEVTATLWRGGAVAARDTNSFETLVEGRSEPLRFRGPRGGAPERARVELSDARCAT